MAAPAVIKVDDPATIVDAFMASGQREATAVSGHTSATYRFQFQGHGYILKTAAESGVYRWLARRTLSQEFEAYRLLADLPGVATCLGLVNRQVLVLEFVDGRSFRRSEIDEPEPFFRSLYENLQAIHGAGVAHGDLKAKDNILVTADESPVLIDFGTAIRFKPGFHPVNHVLFSLACRLDVNAFLKHKYGSQLEGITSEDRALYRLTGPEKLSRLVREGLKWLTRGITNF